MYTYDLSPLVTVDSEVELSLLDTPSRPSTSEPDVVVRRREGHAPTVEWTGRSAVVTVPPSLPVGKDASGEPVEFTRLLLSTVQAMLLRRGATLAFGAAFRAPNGDGVGLFGPSNCGKSTAAFHLARTGGVQLLADDLLVLHEGWVYPFPRHLNLPRDVPAVERWVESEGTRVEQVRLWPGEADVPRWAVTGSVPDRIRFDVVVLAAPQSTPARDPEPVSTAAAVAALSGFRRAALAGWISDPRAREAIDTGDADHRSIVREAVADAACYRLEAPRSDLAQSIARFVR